MNSEEASKLQENYARQRLVWQLANLITNSIHGPVANLLASSSTTCNWSEEDVQLIRKIVTELRGIQRQMHLVENLSHELIHTYLKPSSSPPTSAQNPTSMADGDVPTSKL